MRGFVLQSIHFVGREFLTGPLIPQPGKLQQRAKCKLRFVDLLLFFGPCWKQQPPGFPGYRSRVPLTRHVLITGNKNQLASRCLHDALGQRPLWGGCRPLRVISLCTSPISQDTRLGVTPLSIPPYYIPYPLHTTQPGLRQHRGFVVSVVSRCDLIYLQWCLLFVGSRTSVTTRRLRGHFSLPEYRHKDLSLHFKVPTDRRSPPEITAATQSFVHEDMGFGHWLISFKIQKGVAN